MSQLIDVPGIGVVEFPDNMSDGEIAKAIQRNLPQQTYDPTEGMSILDKMAAGAGKAVYDLGRGAGQILGLVSPQDVAESRKLDQPLMRNTSAKVGNVLGTIGATIPAMFVPGANTLAGAGIVGGGIGALQPTAPGENRAINTALGAGFSMAGHYAGNKLGNWIGRKIAEKQSEQVANAARDQVLKAAQDAGYVVPPTQANPSLTNKALEGLAGKLTTAQRASQKNQAITDKLVRQALGLPKDEPITRETLSALRQNAGEAYEAVKGIGRIKSDAAYIKALDSIKSRFEGAAKDFPALAKPQITDMVESLKSPSFGADSAIDATRILRDSADTAYRTGDKALGKAYRSASDALESLLERNLTKIGQPQLLDRFISARQLIAKTYSVENALNDATGKITASKLAGQLAKGKPISGDLKLVGQFAQAFPKAAQDVQKMGSLPGISPLDYGLAAITGTAGAASGNAPVALVGLARPLTRGGILSGPYQSLMARPNYSTGLLQAAQGALTHTPYGLIPPAIYWSQQ